MMQHQQRQASTGIDPKIGRQVSAEKTGKISASAGTAHGNQPPRAGLL
jgi:hypothetical protein